MNQPSSARILILRSNPISPDPRVEKEAISLASAGYAVRALGWDRTASLPLTEQRQGYIINRLPVQAEYGKGMGNFPQLLRWTWRLWRWLVAHRREYDILHACDFDTILPALWCQKFFGKHVVYDIFDFYADHLRATPQWIKEIIRKVDRWAARQAEAVILVDDARTVQLGGSRPKALSVIYNSPPDLLPGLSQNPSPSPAGELKLAYVGLLQFERGLAQMLNVLAKHPEWKLDLAGFGGDQTPLLQQAQAMPNVHWHGRVQYDVALQLSLDADVLFATYDPSIPNHRYSSPNKIFEAMMLAKPLIAARDSNIDRILEQYDCGLVVDYGDEAQLEKALGLLAADPACRARLGANGRRAYEQVFSWAKMEERLIALYRNI